MRGRKYTSQNREKYGTLERNQTAAERAAENKSEKNIRGMKMDGKTEKNRRTEQKSGILRSIKQKTEKENADAGSPLESLQEPFSRPELVQGYGFSCVLFRDTTQYRQQRPRTPIRICFRNPEIRSCATVSTASNCATGKSDPLERSLYHGKSADDILRRCNCHLR